MRDPLVAAVLAASALAIASCGDDDSEDAGNGGEEETETITGGSARLALNLDAGEYRFYCPVGNHEDAGMVGTLTVR